MLLTHRMRRDSLEPLTRNRAAVRRSLALAASRRARLSYMVAPTPRWRHPDGQAVDRLVGEELSRAYLVRWGFATPVTFDPSRES